MTKCTTGGLAQGYKFIERAKPTTLLILLTSMTKCTAGGLAHGYRFISAVNGAWFSKIAAEQTRPSHFSLVSQLILSSAGLAAISCSALHVGVSCAVIADATPISELEGSNRGKKLILTLYCPLTPHGVMTFVNSP